MRDQLINLIPEFSRIVDQELREKALAVWAEALAQGGWSPEQLTELPFTLLVEGVEISFIQHVRTVARLCLATLDVLCDAYGDLYDIDEDTLLAGALLADVGKLIEFSHSSKGPAWSITSKYLRHPFIGVGLCYKHGIPESVMHVVATHSWEGDRFKRTPESIIFHHADFTDFELAKT